MENCTDCLFAEERRSIINDRLWYVCKNENAPYYDEYVSEEQNCRLFIDYEKYIKLKDRKDNIDNLLNNGNL